MNVFQDHLEGYETVKAEGGGACVHVPRPCLTLQHAQASPYLSMASVRVHLIRLSEIDWSESLLSYGEIGSAVREVILVPRRIELLGEVG